MPCTKNCGKVIIAQVVVNFFNDIITYDLCFYVHSTYIFESYFHEFFSFLFVKFLFSSHKSKVHGKKSKKFQCTVCDLQCPNRSKLKTHIEEVHEKIKVSCPQCQKLFSKGGLRNHIKYYHEVDRISKPFKCDECHVQFEVKHDSKILNIEIQ